MVTYELNGTSALTSSEKRMLAEAKELSVTYDDDSPELTDEMERAFMAARKAKPYQGEPLTLYVSAETLEKVKTLGADYIAILSKLLDKAVDEYRAVP